MLDSLTVVNSQGSILELPLWDMLSGFAVKEITGLDPVKATIVTSKFATIDGEQYQNSQREKRNVIVKLKLDTAHPTNDVRSLRALLYNFFMPKKAIDMVFGDSDGTNYLISGRIESFDSPIFAKDPDTTISVLCFDPDFYLPGSTVISASTVSTSTVVPITYLGTVDTGVEFELAVDRTLAGFTFSQSAGTDYVRMIEVTYPFIAGDKVRINTNPSLKKVTLLRAGIESSILYAKSSSSSWIELQPGVNTLRVYADGAAIPYTVTYKTKFGGL